MYTNTISNNFIYNNFKNVQQRFSKYKKAETNDLQTEKPTEPTTSKKNKITNIGLITLGVGILFMSKGVQKQSKKILEFFKEYFENKINNSFLDEHTPKIGFYEYFVRRINFYIKKTESINNINSLKDILFMKLMYKTAPTKAIHKSISDFFEKISRNTVRKSYKKTQKMFDKMYEKFDKLDEYILENFGDDIVEIGEKKYKKRDLILMARDHREDVRTIVTAFIQESTQDSRYAYIKNATSQLYTKFWNESFKGFWSKDNKFQRKEMWQTFIAAEQVKNNKTDLAKNIAFTRDLLSYTDAEMKAYISGYIENINSIIPYNDAIAVDITKKLKWFVKDSSTLNFNKEHFLNEINKLEEHFNKNIKDKESEELVNDINTNLKLIKHVIDEEAPGDIQKMIDIYKRIAPFELSKSGALDSVKKAVKMFDKSIKLESKEFFDKLRDLEIGSAPTDILTILFSSALITHALVKAKDPSEKKSIMLKSGIPIAGAILTTMISATKLISGSKSIALGIVSGIILNRLGSLADNYTKKQTQIVKHQ